MKKVLLLFTVLLLVACSQVGQKSIEDRATDQLKKTMKEALNNPDDATLSGVRTVYQSDSLCVIDFTLKAKNNEGKMITQSVEYIYIDLDKMSNKDFNIFKSCFFSNIYIIIIQIFIFQIIICIIRNLIFSK